nr:hypothetical protein [Streptacidiphilus jeojiense]
MTLTGRGSRRIVVDDVAYRWRVRRRPTYSQSNGWGQQSYAVEHETNPGTTLVVETGRAHPGNWFNLTSAPIRPAQVAGNIRQALAQGWKPEAPGSPFFLHPHADTP